MSIRSTLVTLLPDNVEGLILPSDIRDFVAATPLYDGAWEPGSYSLNDVVLYAGASYICVNSSGTSATPGASADWQASGDAFGAAAAAEAAAMAAVTAETARAEAAEADLLADGGSVTVLPSSSGIVSAYGVVASVANGSTGSVMYTVTSGKTLYLKGASASSSGAPCKVQVVANGTILQTKYYSLGAPHCDFSFPQPVSVPAGDVVAVNVINQAGAAQDVYGFISGLELV